MEYTQPEVVDYGDLPTMTQAAGSLGSEDGAGKTIQVGVGDVLEVSLGLLP